MSFKRDRTDSPEIPGLIYSSQKRSKSESPTVLDYSGSNRRLTQGVETVPLGPNDDLQVVSERLITNLARQGKLFVRGSLRVLGNNLGGFDVSTAWVLDFEKSKEYLASLHELGAQFFKNPYSSKTRADKPLQRVVISSNTPPPSRSPSAQPITGVGLFEDPIVLSEDEIDGFNHNAHSTPRASTPNNGRDIPESLDGDILIDAMNQDTLIVDNSDIDSFSDTSGQEDDGDEDRPIRPHLASPGPDLRLPSANGSQPSHMHANPTVLRPLSRFPQAIPKKKVKVGNGAKPTAIPADDLEIDAKVFEIGVPRPKKHGKSRRIIENCDFGIWATVSMGGDVQFLTKTLRHRLHECSMPGDESYHVEDLCLVGGLAVVGHGRRNPRRPSHYPQEQVRIFSFDNVIKRRTPIWISSGHRPHSKEGIQSLAAVDDSRFLSGGYDGRVHLWNLYPDQEPTSSEIGVFFGLGVRALSYISQDQTVIGSHGVHVKIFDLEKPINSEGYRIANFVNHIHSCIDHPDVVALEVKDINEQIYLFDRREGFDTRPSMRFGCRERGTLHSDRYTRGSMKQCYFARGYNDGTVMLWDFRNSKSVIQKLRASRKRSVGGTSNSLRIAHTMFSAVDLVAFGDNVVTVYEAVV